MFLYSCAYIDGAGKKRIKQEVSESAHHVKIAIKKTLTKADTIIAETMEYIGNNLVHVYELTYRDNCNEYNLVMIHGLNELNVETVFGELFNDVGEIESVERVDLDG